MNSTSENFRYLTGLPSNMGRTKAASGQAFSFLSRSGLEHGVNAQEFFRNLQAAAAQELAALGRKSFRRNGLSVEGDPEKPETITFTKVQKPRV